MLYVFIFLLNMINVLYIRVLLYYFKLVMFSGTVIIGADYICLKYVKCNMQCVDYVKYNRRVNSYIMCTYVNFCLKSMFCY